MCTNLVLRGDTSPARAFSKYLPLSVFFGLSAVLFIVIGALFSEEAAYNAVGYQNYKVVYVGGKLVMILLGICFIAAAVMLPFASVSETKKCFIDVYEDLVRGAYREGDGKETRFVPFELTYDKIEAVSANKNKVYLQITGRTLESRAFNAAQIANAISNRLPGQQRS